MNKLSIMIIHINVVCAGRFHVVSLACLDDHRLIVLADPSSYIIISKDKVVVWFLRLGWDVLWM
jgi:hypothetical protein